jgi:FkbM family methyltransferase
MERELAVPMRDGVRLYVNLFSPEADRPYPVTMFITPHGKDRLPVSPVIDSLGRRIVPMYAARRGRSLPSYQLTIAEGGNSARIQLQILLGYASVIRLLGRRGLQRLAWTLGKIFPRRNSVVLSQGGRRYKVYLNDGYYTHLLPKGFVYEPEVELVLDRIITDRGAFIDCGANNGYWSVYAARKSGDPERVVAIEPTYGPFTRLQENRWLNRNSFRIMKRAVYSEPGIDLPFSTHPQRHAENAHAARACGSSAARRGEEELVRTITIDEVCDAILSSVGAAEPIVVKIDVEGLEIEAFLGAQRTIGRGALLLYEDHGSDPSCRNTEFLLHQFQLAVYLLNETSPPTKIENIQELRRLKRKPQRGYNLLAGKPGAVSLERALRTG